VKMNDDLCASDYKSRARESLKGKYWLSVGITAIASLLMGSLRLFNMEFKKSSDTTSTFSVPYRTI
jgi:hypothetical protein